MKIPSAYPLFWYQRGKDSDRNWIFKMLHFIPDSKKQEVSDQYEKLFFGPGNGRKKANEFLHGVAKEYRTNASKQKAL